jgi:hypothetical protein
MKGEKSMSTRIRPAAMSLVVLCTILMTACFGLVPPPDFDFLDRFPASRKLSNKDLAQIIRGFHFHDETGAGKVTVTFGDADEEFKIPGSFIFTDMKKGSFSKILVNWRS